MKTEQLVNGLTIGKSPILFVLAAAALLPVAGFAQTPPPPPARPPGQPGSPFPPEPPDSPRTDARKFGDFLGSNLRSSERGERATRIGEDSIGGRLRCADGPAAAAGVQPNDT